MEPEQVSPHSDRNADLSTIPHPAFVFDADGRIADVNTLAATLVGYPGSDLVGARISSVLDAPSALDASERTRFVPVGSGGFARHREGMAVPVEILLCPYDRFSTMALVCKPRTGADDRDIAEIVHDLKGPLATISLETFVLGDRDPVGVVQAIARINQNVFYVDRVVQELLDSCAIDAGRLEIQRRPTELRAMLAQILKGAVASRDRMRISLEAESPVTLAIDDLRIERVVRNLIGNALKFAPRSRIVLRLESADSCVRVSVTDSGPGLTPAEVAYVFDRYRRTASALGCDGSGLGLFVSKQIIEEHGGTMGVASTLGTGSQFFFELPMQ